MKIILNILLLILVVLAMSLLISANETPTPKPRVISNTEESTCRVQMCESLGGHDAIALQVMFGD